MLLGIKKIIYLLQNTGTAVTKQCSSYYSNWRLRITKLAATVATFVWDIQTYSYNYRSYFCLGYLNIPSPITTVATFVWDIRICHLLYIYCVSMLYTLDTRALYSCPPSDATCTIECSILLPHK